MTSPDPRRAGLQGLPRQQPKALAIDILGLTEPTGGVPAASLATPSMDDTKNASAVAAARLSDAAAWLIACRPFYGLIVLRLPRVEDPLRTVSIGLALRGGRPTLCYNAHTVNQWTIAETAAVLAHEAIHLTLRHPTRGSDRRAIVSFSGQVVSLWNIACDVACNQWLEADLPAGGVFPETFGLPRGAAAELYYHMLERQLGAGREIDADTWARLGLSTDPNARFRFDDHRSWCCEDSESRSGANPTEFCSESGVPTTTGRDAVAATNPCADAETGSGQGKPNLAQGSAEPAATAPSSLRDSIANDSKPVGARRPNRALDDPRDVEPEDEREAESVQWDSTTVDAHIQELIQSVIVHSKDRFFGNTPGALLRQVGLDALLARAPIAWNDLLRRIVGWENRMGYRLTHKRPSRRFPGNPGRVPIRGAEIALAIDTSASIGAPLLDAFVAEVAQIARARGNASSWLIECDAQVQNVRRLVHGREPLGELRGGGGTDFRPALAHARRWNPACLIYFTDLEGRFPDRADFPKYRVIWVVPPGCRASAPPFGRVVEMNTHARAD